MKLILLILIFAYNLSACSVTTVQPWQREVLARVQMQMEHPIDTAFDSHIYYSKEASSGGPSFAGGGCGCN